ncbi:cilia- and flagella-associated protein 65 [Echeneis naucrates]|uniref:cilia- and flagella-associated protein 65 n=1 Tax=Echeneis naucrates TaxID=173247 RepID=UPI00111450EB|nr:cilia- and flagella-associated protein 65 [Echeneis naucrates]
MLAEAGGPEPAGSDPTWLPSVAGDDFKDLGNHPSHQGGEHQTHASSKCCSLGLETKSELIWEDWDQGKEFTKTLALKNIHNKLQKLHFRPPVSKFFSTLIPQIIVLSPGTSFSIPITFRPLQRCEYEDSIEFQGKDGSFQVRLLAIIPCYALEVPDSVLLPVCAVQHSSHTTFRLKNASKLHTRYEWVCAAPFQLRPEQGLLKPSQECHITVIFRPQEAMVYQQQALCKFGEEGDKAKSYCTVLLQALAKYPCLQLKNPAKKKEKEQEGLLLHFGSVAIGKSLQKHFDIFNPSPVTASFFLSRQSSRMPLFGSEFSCDVTSGKVAPGESTRVMVTYSPVLVDSISVEYLFLKCRGALNETSLKLSGNCIGPKVSLSSSVVDFGCVEEGKAVIQTVELVNSSPAEAIYQWDLDCSGHSVFSIQPASGTVHPQSCITLKVVYKPGQPITHYRRVACIILHRDPLFLDLIGTCHSELQKPAILKPEHLVLYKLHWNRRQDPSEICSVMQKDKNVHLDHQLLHSALEEHSNHGLNSAAVPKAPMEEFYQICLGCTDPLFSSSSSSPHISVVPCELLFDHKMSSHLSTSATSSQSVSIINHTTAKLSLVWTVAQDSPFTVSPSSCDLASLKTTSFRVTYDPKQINTLHGAQLECFAYYKMDHIGMGLLCPPWCVTVRVIGHSFQPGKEHFIPCCSLKPSQVTFPALGILSYQTALLQNDGDLPLTFCLDHSSNSALAEPLSLIPNCGLIQPGHHQILTLRTTPSENSPKLGFNIKLQLNAAKHSKELTVVSVVEKLSVSQDGDGSLYFQPTAVGSRTQRSHHIRNLSRVPLRFQWTIPEPDQDLIFVEPDAGELHPNESSVQTWSFTPLAEKTYMLKPALNFWPVQTNGSNKKSHLTLNVVGIGSKGFIEAEKPVLDLEQVLVGSYQSIEIPLLNNSPCTVSFHLSVQQILMDEEFIYETETEPSALQLECERGDITSHSTLLLRASVRPYRRTEYLWKISYQTLNTSGFVSSPPQVVCEVRAKGVFPTLQVTDVCSVGSAAKLSKLHLWKLFSLDNLNKNLLANPSSAELTYRTPTRHSLRSCPSIFTKTVLDFNFCATSLNSEPSTFVLMFHNPGSIAVDWSFLFPEDQQIELEYWAETGEFSSTELYQMKVQDNRLFSISPRAGTLHPGQQRAVYFSYSHGFAGTDRLPVVFKLSYGREILLNFHGVTIERDRPYLHFAANQHLFTSVTIGECHPPRQMYELHNAGDVPVHYEVDRDALLQLQEENFNHPVLCCLSPEGEVPPGKTVNLEWMFSPLEAKMYHMDVPIHIQGGESTVVRFEGCGSDTSIESSSKPFNCADIKIDASCVQRVPFPEQVVFLSEDIVSLGHIPVGSQYSRILFLTNLSHTDTVHYKWDLPEQSNEKTVQICPEEGSLCPEESGLCVLTFTSSDYPTIYQLDIICQVIRQAALTQYHKALRCWERGEERKRDEFIITDKNLSEIQRTLIDKVLQQNAIFLKDDTLPPICARSNTQTVGLGTNLTRAERRAQRGSTKVQKQPEHPQPALLHLEVTAHSHKLSQYRTHFPDQFNTIYRPLHSVQPQKTETASVSLSQPTHLPEKDIHVHVLSSLLREILDDSTFVESLMTLASKPVTYQPTKRFPSHCPPQLQSQDQLRGTRAGLIGEYTVNRKGPEGLWGDTNSTLYTQHVLDDMCETVLLNTLQNLMMEAVRGELELTAHPRTVILPPASTRTRRMSRTMAEERHKASPTI